MELTFTSDTHTYKSINDPDKIWTSVTSLIKLFKEPFNQEEIAAKCSKNKKSKWYNIPPEKIVAYWTAEADRSVTMGTWYHNQRESEVVACETIRREGLDLPIFQPAFHGELRISPDQALVPGIYPEHFMYLKSAGICGQADRVEVIGNRVDLFDYKTNKKIDTAGYTNWEGKTKMMYPPLEHLDDCNLIHYAMQLSLYMYIVLKHNHTLEPGKLTIHHIVFEVADRDEFGFPKIATDFDGNPIVKEVVPYELPYLRKEVISLINYIKLNPKILEHENIL